MHYMGKIQLLNDKVKHGGNALHCQACMQKGHHLFWSDSRSGGVLQGVCLQPSHFCWGGAQLSMPLCHSLLLYGCVTCANNYQTANLLAV